MTTKEFAIAYASKLVADYPEAKTVEDLMDIAVANNRFENKTQMLSVWGRVLRLLPRKAVS